MNQLDQLEAESPVTKLGTLGETFVSSTTWPDGIRHAQTHIRAAAEFGLENELTDATSLLRTVDELIDVLLMTYTDSEAQTTVAAMSQFCKAAIDATSDELNGKDVDPATIPNLLAIADERWSDYLSNSRSNDAYDAWACDSNVVETVAEVECPEPHQTCDLNDGDSQQIGLILGALGGLDQIVKESVASLPAASAPSPPPATSQTATEPPSEPSPFGTTDNSEPLSAPAPVTIDIDQETVNAFADDAVQCVSVIETEVLRYEQDPNSLDALRQICRELHTIKGASAAIGLSELAGFLHRVEDSLEQSCQAATQTDVEVVLQSVDAVRSQLEVLVEATSNQPASVGEANAKSSPAVFDASATPDSIRVNAGQLDRLFDMLAELVMLRNRRDSNVGHLKRVNAELLHCVSRLRSLAEHVPSQAAFGGDDDVGPIPISSLTEIASDMLELGRTLRQTIDPITEENITLSRFIDQFRSEVIELRRLPVQSLFTRLQRPIRDAAKTEGKKVQVRFVNEHVGLERSLHEKLYEPLMHVVRNAVSHGIELPEDRLAADKPEEGTITIEAHSGSNLFVIEVRDNGKGLDYDVVRKLAIERGLVSADEQLTQEEIANLIFRPGFSTRDVVSEVSGRGVGMDVVAGSVEELHGWVELESKNGEGTCIRLLVPRSSFIESTLVFRLGEQYFAFPTRFVVPFAADSPNETGIQIRKVLAPQADPPTAQVPVRIESPDQPNREAITVWVDEVVGTEEVVTRPLPALMNTQRLFTGVTLSGAGDILLIVNAETLLTTDEDTGPAPVEVASHQHNEAATASDGRFCVLVADDSVTARLSLCRILHSIQDCEILEAKDGSEALLLYKANRERVDLVITDIDMPRMTGFDLLREIQVLSRSGPVAPVTVLSSRSDQRSRDCAIQFGAFHHLTKPANESSVQQVIDRVIAQRDGSQSVEGEVHER